jgi:hypothetical protein
MTKHVDSIFPSKCSLKDPCERMEGTSHLNKYRHINPTLSSHQDTMDIERLNGTRIVNHSHFQRITSIMVSYEHLRKSSVHRITRKGGGYIHLLLMVWKPILTSCKRILDSNAMLSSLSVALCSMFAMSLQWPSVLRISTSHKNMRLPQLFLENRKQKRFITLQTTIILPFQTKNEKYIC